MSTPEIITVNSESLEATIRDLLPSQNGFGSELQASNVIMPIIDLTATAEGSILGTDLQTSISFADATVVNVGSGASQVVANSPGFYRLTINVMLDPSSGVSANGFVSMTDGSTVKKVLDFHNLAGTDVNLNLSVDKVFFLRAGDSLTCESATVCTIRGSIRQIATVTGTLNPPTGFVAE